MARAKNAAGLNGAVNVVVMTKDRIREMNRCFRKKNKPTDVLSFPAPDIGGPYLHASGRCGSNAKFAGDIAICADIAAENGATLGHGAGTELKILVLHGLLHLAGYDHETDDGQMARKERKLRRDLRLPDGLIERNTSRGERPAPRNGRRS